MDVATAFGAMFKPSGTAWPITPSPGGLSGKRTAPALGLRKVKCPAPNDDTDMTMGAAKGRQWRRRVGPDGPAGLIFLHITGIGANCG